MQPGVTVVLATIWLAAYVNVVGTASLHPSRLTLDQYTPLAPHQRQHGVYRRVEGQLDWKDQNPAENQPFDLSISPRRSISVSVTDGGSEEQSYKSKYLEKDSMLRRSGNNAGDDFSPLLEDKQFSNFVEEGFTEEKSDAGGTKGQKSVSREPLPPYELENPPVADGTFQDQGPSSVEIYKLDQPREKSSLSSTSITKIVSNSKSKTPKKTNHSNWKDKTTEYKASTSPKSLRKQSNSSDDFSTEILSNHDPFSIGGVPELQVGCEGLEASDPNKEKRSIDYSLVRDKSSKDVEPWMAVTPISLDIDYEISGEEGYEEMDELFKLKKLETTTKAAKQNRGDMEPNLHSNFFDKKPTDKLPVRGDLGKFNVNNQPTVQPVTFGHGNQQSEENVTNSEALRSVDRKEGVESEVKSTDGSVTGTNQRRKILWLDDPDDAKQPMNEGRVKRTTWGFGEDEGVLSSDELQTANIRRRKEYEMRLKEQERRRAEEARRRNDIENRTNSDIKKIREEYEKLLEQQQREEEERQQRLLHQNLQRIPVSNRWQQEDERRQRLQEEIAEKGRWLNEERKRQELEAYRRRHESRPQSLTYEEEKERRMEMIRRLKKEEENRTERPRWEEEIRRRQQEEMDRRELEERRREWMLKEKQQEEAERRRQQEEAERRRQQEEAERRQQEEAERRRQQEEANRRRQHEEAERRRQQEEANRRRQHEEAERRRQQEEENRRRQQEEEERRRQQQYKNEPANLLRTRPSTNRSYDPETEQRIREQQEAERRRKLNMYIQRNQPINLRDQQREEADRRRQEEERKLQEYIRRNQPVRLPKVNETYDRNLLDYRRRVDEARHYNRLSYPGAGNGRRNHGPSAPTNIDPRNYVDENRRREAARRLEEERMQERRMQQQEELHREILRREEETRRMQSRRYEEERQKLAARRLEEERREKERLEEEARKSQAGRTRPLENSRLGYEDRRRLEEHRRHDTSLIPGNLVLNGSRRAMELQKQRQEQERRRLEAEWRRRANSRTNEGRQNEQHRSGAMEAQWRRQEEARLNALPVSAKIIVKPAVSSSVPKVIPRTGFNTDIGFLGVNPNGPGVEVPTFPAPSTRRPLENSPPPCVWAVVQCCSSHVNRLVSCFETMGCPGVNWDPNPCRLSITQAAREQVSNFYAEEEKFQRGF